MKSIVVQEIQGLYGPFSISEAVLQKIWFCGDFHQKGLQTQSGKSLEIIDPGGWNKNEGPDFLEARLVIDGVEVVGDIEVHFYPRDWYNHGHDNDRNFSRVVLHVFLYDQPTSFDADSPMEALVLMPLLERDLESYAMDVALMDLEQVNEIEWFERFMDQPLSKRIGMLEELSADRWKQKTHFAQKRLSASDWNQCCHESTLEVLGFSRNRAVMHKLACRYSLVDFASGLDVDQVFQEFGNDWKLSGSRPINHPRLRLQQYARICAANPNWPEALLERIREQRPCDEPNPIDFRKHAATKEFQSLISEDVFQGIFGERKLNTLLCDAVFPLAEATVGDYWRSYWHHWYPGDYPDAFLRFFAQVGLVEAGVPRSNGLLQGILALFYSKGEILYREECRRAG